MSFSLSNKVLIHGNCIGAPRCYPFPRNILTMYPPREYKHRLYMRCINVCITYIPKRVCPVLTSGHGTLTNNHSEYNFSKKNHSKNFLMNPLTGL